MNIHKENFKLWFRGIIEALYENGNAGFPILMITFPLLERYLRSKSEINQSSKLGLRFYDELGKLFPVLKDKNIEEKFWVVYRHGILHQATLPQRKSEGIQVPAGWLSGKGKDIEIDENGAFWVNPVEFAKRVIDVIDKDFQTFEATSLFNLATIQTTPDGSDATCGEFVKSSNIKKY